MNTIESALTVIAPIFVVTFFLIISFAILEKQTPQWELCGDMYVMEWVYNKLYKEKWQEYAENSKTYRMLLNRIKACVESQEWFVSQETKKEWELLKSSTQ